MLLDQRFVEDTVPGGENDGVRPSNFTNAWGCSSTLQRLPNLYPHLARSFTSGAQNR